MKGPRLAALAVGALVLALLGFGWFLSTRPRALPPAPAPPASASAARTAPAHAPGGMPSWPRQRLYAAEAARDEGAAQAVFQGQVISTATGKGIPGAELTFAHEGAASRVLSEADGSFRFVTLEAGRYELALATAAGHVPFAPSYGESPIAWTARPGERVYGISVALAPAVTYTGLVEGPDHKPVASAQIAIFDELGERASSAGAPERLLSDARGEFRFSAPDYAVVEATHPGFAPGRAQIDLGVQVSHRLVIRLGPSSERANLDGVITGKVVDGKGAPVEGASVRAFVLLPPGPAPRVPPTIPDARSDEEGQFAIEGLDRQRHYRVVASYPELAPAEAPDVAAGARDLVLSLSRGGSLRGAVHDQASGKPVAAFTVVISSRLGPLAIRPFTQRAFVDAQGRYEIGGLPPGTFTVEVAARGYAPSSEATATVQAPPGEPIVLDFTLGKGGRVSGTVVDAKTQAPIAGARLSLEGRLGMGAEGAPLLASALTDASGRFELEGLAKGLRSLSVVAAGHHARILSGLAVEGSGDVGPVTVALTPIEPGEEPHMEMTGIGAVLAPEGDALVIRNAIPGGGAAEAGLGPGDAVVGIEGQTVTALGFEEAIERIRGPEGSAVLLSVRRADGETVAMTVLRRRIRSR